MPRFAAPFHAGAGLPLAGPLGAELDLTAEQKEAARALRDAFEDTVAPLIEFQRERFAELDALLESDEPDPLQVGTLMIEVRAAGRNVEALREALEQEILSLLDTEQAARWQELKNRRAERGPLARGVLPPGRR